MPPISGHRGPRRSPSSPTACSPTACSSRCRRCRCASRCRGSRRRRVDDMVRVAQAADDAGFLYVAVCHHVAIPPEPAEMMSTQWFDPIADARLPRRAHDAHAADDERVHRRVPTAARDRQGVRHARPAVERSHDRRHRRRARRRRVRRAGRLVLGPGQAHRRRARHDLRPRSTTSGPRPRPRAEVGQRPRPVQQPHPPIWIGGSGKPALRRVATMADGWIPQATPLDQLPDDIATILRERDQVRPGAVPEIGYHLVAHVGEPTWDLPEGRDARLGRSHRRVREQAARRDRRLAPAGAPVRPRRRRALRPDRARSAPRSGRNSSACNSRSFVSSAQGLRDGVPLDAARLPCPALRARVVAGDLRDRARAVRVGRSARLRLARAVGAPRRRRRLDARAAHDGRPRCSPAPTRARRHDQRRDPAAARPDPRSPNRSRCSTTRSRAACGSCSAPATASRSSRWRAWSTRRAGRILEEHVGAVLEALTGETFEWRGRDVRRHAQARHRSAPDVVRRRGSARRGRAGRRGCGSRCSR